MCKNLVAFIKGPDLPAEFIAHCMTKINEDLVVILGGRITEKKTLLVDISNNFSIKEGPTMIHGRDFHACGTFLLNGKTVVFTAGGYDGSKDISTEFWDPTSEDGWIKGTVGKIYTSIFSFFRKRVVNIAILEMGLVSNEKSGKVT